MARFKLARRTSAPKFRRGPSPLVGKLKTRLAAANRRARLGGGGAGTMMRDVLSAGGAAALGKAEQAGYLPAKIGPFDSALVIGALGAFVLPRVMGGKVARIGHDLTVGALCVAAYRIGSGAPLMGDEDDMGAGGWG